MRALTSRPGDPIPDERNIAKILAKMLQNFMENGFEKSDRDRAMDEFNEKADQMPTAAKEPEMGPHDNYVGRMDGMKKMSPHNPVNDIRRGNLDEAEFGKKIRKPGASVGKGVKPRRRLLKRR